MLTGPPTEKPQDGPSGRGPGAGSVFRPGPQSKNRVPQVDVTLPPLPPLPPGRRPPSFGFESLIGESSVLAGRRNPDRPLTLVELPGLIAQYGPSIAVEDSLWSEGPRLVVSALGAHIPVAVASASPAHVTSEPRLLDRNEENQRDEYRPYDLELVGPGRAGPDHYALSSSSVLQETQRGPGAMVSLEDWCREAQLWRALRTIPFFRDYWLHQAFTWWRRNVSRIVFQCRCDNLQAALLHAVPQFRHGLVLLTGVLEELVELRWLPSTRHQTYALQEFQDTLVSDGGRSAEALGMLLRRRAAILNAVHQECYDTHQELQRLVEHASKEPTGRGRPHHLQLARRRCLEVELERARRASRELGRVASLADRMTTQGLCSLSRREVTAFLREVVEVGEIESTRGEADQGCLFRAQLVFNPKGTLAVDPVLQLFQDEVQEALLGLSSTILQLSSFSMKTFTMRSCLEWQLGASDVSSEVEAQSEVRRLCDGYMWLVDAHSFTASRGAVSSLEALRGGAVSTYQELVGEAGRWHDWVRRTPPSFATDNRLFLIDASGVLEELGMRLGVMEEQLHSQLVEELRLNSESLVSWLRSTITELQQDPADLRSFALHVKRKSSSPEMQQCLEYLGALQGAITSHYREMNDQEMELEEQTLRLWSSYVNLVKAAEEKVLQRMPSMSEALERTFVSLVSELSRTASVAAATSSSSGVPLDPAEVCVELRFLCTQANVFGRKIRELAGISEELRGYPLDLKVMATDLQNMETLKELWELLAVCRAAVQEWGHLHFTEFDAAEAQEKVALLKQRAASLVLTAPTHDAVLQEIRTTLEQFSQHLLVLDKLSSPRLKEKHIKNIFKGMGLLYMPEKKLTVTELMSMPLREHMDIINKISREANIQWDMEQEFRNIQCGWEAKLFPMSPSVTALIWHMVVQNGHDTIYTQLPSAATRPSSPTATPQSGNATLVIGGLDRLRAEAEDSVMALCSMLWSPYCSDFKPQVEQWTRLLQELEELLEMLERYQERWAFLTETLNGTSGAQTAELLERFHAVNETFMEIVFSVSSDRRVLSVLRPQNATSRHIYGDNLRVKLLGGLSNMEAISAKLGNLLDRLRREFPRLFFLGDREVMELVSPQPATAAHLLAIVGKCFQGVRRLELDHKAPSDSADSAVCQSTDGSSLQMQVLGVFGSLVEHVRFLQPVKPHIDPVLWLCTLEEQLRHTMMKLIEQCAAARHQLHAAKPDSKLDRDDQAGKRELCLMVDLLCHYPLQCLLVAEESAWCGEVLQASQIPAPDRWRSMKQHNSSRLQHLCSAIREGAVGIHNRSPLSHRVMLFLQDLVHFTMTHAQRLSRFINVQCELEASFEWQSMMKYHITLAHHSPNISNNCHPVSSDVPTCYINVLGSTLMYGYEYLGPEHWAIVTTPSTDRAVLGIILAVTSYRCGLVSGPSACGKRTTVAQLGQAFGYQVVTLQCCSSTSLGVIQQVLSGALMSGAYLVLHSVNLLIHGVQASLGQHLTDIHRFFSGFQRDTVQGLNVEPNCSMSFAGKTIFPRLNYGCIAISSKAYACDITANLWEATRSVSFAHPDYRTITEVLLLSSGFTEAANLSQRLMTLFDLAKDSGCLPKSAQASWLLVLQNLIAVSAKQSFCKEHMSFEGTSLSLSTSATYGKPQIGAHNAAGEVSQTDRPNMSLKAIYQVRAIVRGVIEEEAAVNAIYTILLPAFDECGTACEFRRTCEEIFPTACSFTFPPQNTEKEQNLLNIAIAEELEITGLFTDTQIIPNVLALHKALKSSQAVLLLGPPGCGKTTCHLVLAGSLRRLATGAGDVPSEAGMNTLKAAHRNPVSTWSPVETMVLFPNAMSHQEFLGDLSEERGWLDGAFTKVLRESEHRSGMFPQQKRAGDKTQRVKWLVMDGEPLGQPGWLDYYASLSSPEDPVLCLPSGERIRPGHSQLKLLAEFTDLSDASPSSVTRCSVMYFTGTNLWKSVWKAELESLSREGSLDQGTLAMWCRLAEDLFGRTLRSLRQNNLTSAMYTEGDKDSTNPVIGLREVMSFIRILRALLEDSGAGTDFKDLAKTQDSDDDDLNNSKHLELRERNIFLLAYVWGFGAHLHPRHWPQFDQLARQLLFDSRYRIEVPGEEIIFEHFFSLTDICEVITSINGPRSYIAELPFPMIPKHQKHVYLLHRLLEAGQSALLAGEAASGRTSLCRALLSSANRPHVSMMSGPLLSHQDVRNTLSNPTPTVGRVGTKRSGLVLFVDDLHDAPSDAFGKASMALETLRLSMSTEGSPTPGSYHFKLFVPGSVNYLATCLSSSRGGGEISFRLSRLFSIFVLPMLSSEVLFSIHAPALQLWLKDVPHMHSPGDLAHRIISATEELYHTVSEHFPLTENRPHFVFSHHDLQKVPSEPLAALFDVTRLWMHECLRTFGDRLCCKEESKLLLSLISRVSERCFPSQHIQHMVETLDLITYGPDFSTTTHTKTAEEGDSGPDLSYWGQRRDELVPKLSAALQDVDPHSVKAAGGGGIGSTHVIHQQRALQLLHILRALLVPRGHGLLLACARATGRKTNVRLAACIAGRLLMEVHRGNEGRLDHILKQAGRQVVGGKGGEVVMLVHQDVSQALRDRVLAVMAHGAGPGLYSGRELAELIPRDTAVEEPLRGHVHGQMIQQFFRHFQRCLHVFLLMPFSPDAVNSQDCNLQLSRALSLACCVELYQAWTRQSLLETAAHLLTRAPLLSCVDADRTPAFSPRCYVEFISHFLHLRDQLHTQGLTQANRVEGALARLEALIDTALHYRQEVERLREKVGKLKQREEELLRALEAEEESPLVQSGVEALRCLRLMDLEEVRHYRDPPEGVVQVLDALCVLFSRPCGWDSIKQLLGQQNFYEELEFFNHRGLSDSQLQRLAKVVDAPYFLPAAAREVSVACESLCHWSRAVFRASLARRRAVPLEAGRQHLLALADEARQRFGAGRKREEEGGRRICEVKCQLRGVRSNLEGENARLEAAAERERRAAITVAMTDCHLANWTAKSQEVRSNSQTLQGDALLLAATVCYLGPFGPALRAELLDKWRLLCQTGDIDPEPQDPRATLFTGSGPAPLSDPPPQWTAIPLAERLQGVMSQALGGARPQQVEWSRDEMVVRLLLWGHRGPRPALFWPLLADAQGWDEYDGPPGWLLAGNYDLVVCADHPGLIGMLDSAEERGLSVLVSHVERAVPSPQFLARLVRSSGTGGAASLTGLGNKVWLPDPDFNLVLCTALPVRLLHEIHPSVLAEVRVVDMSPSPAQLQEIMLGRILPSEGMEPLVQQHASVQKEIHRLQERIKDEQISLMDYILGTAPPLSDDPGFPPCLLACQGTSVELRAQVDCLVAELRRLDSLLGPARQASALAALLYRTLQDVSCLSPAYCFTLRGYIRAMRREALQTLENPDGWWFQEGSGGDAVATQGMAGCLLALYRPCLSPSHARVLQLLAATAALHHDGLCSETERSAFLCGLRDVGRTEPDLTLSVSLPDWITAELRADLALLEQVPTFRGLLASLVASPHQWREYLCLPSRTVTGEAACPSHSHLTLLQRGILWRTLLPGSLEAVARDLVTCVLGSAGDKTSSRPPDAFCRFVTDHRGPVVFTRPNAGGLHPLHLLRQLASQQEHTKEVHVEVVQLATGWDGDLLLSALGRAVTKGHWLVLNDCHLLDQWDDRVVFYVNRLFSGPRAWMRVCGLPVVCDPPWDLKQELSLTLGTVPRPSAGPPADGLLLRCALLHATLRQRHAHSPSEERGDYHWSHNDLLALTEAFARVSGHCHDKTDTLENLVGVVYGGHVSNPEDLEEVRAVAKALICPVVPPCGGGPSDLINIIHPLPDHCDPQKLVVLLEQRIQTLSDHHEPTALGFSPLLAEESVRTRSHILDTLLRLSQQTSVEGRLVQRSFAPSPGRAFQERLVALSDRLLRRDDEQVGGLIRDFLRSEWAALGGQVSSMLARQGRHGCPLGDQLSRLERRAKLIAAYLWAGAAAEDPPGTYRPGAFSNPRGLLTAVLREEARRRHTEISHLVLEFQVLSDSTPPRASPPGSVHLCGLRLRGAQWGVGGLEAELAPASPSPASPSTPPGPPCHSLPPLCITPLVVSRHNGGPNGNATPVASSSSPGMFRCPLYLEGGKLPVCWVPLVSRLDPGSCRLQRVRLTADS
ncbi:hypothetical protein NHX12_018737 [Muraenolepis orangiensis]|uniref:Dynein heavy chain domain-containing protein 1 n=1 Tax=Muraenolepis orangiensis TaxID=630683 RepID=A0A9Q0EXV3_9TELE|nr:hypothetical protein NHX12_018737 [Muraenolepis orangiensis]